MVSFTLAAAWLRINKFEFELNYWTDSILICPGATCSSINTITNIDHKLRPGKVDSLFPISHFLNFDAGGWSLFIMTSQYIQYVKIFLLHRKIANTNTENHKPVINVALKQIQVIQPGAFHKD